MTSAEPPQLASGDVGASGPRGRGRGGPGRLVLGGLLVGALVVVGLAWAAGRGSGPSGPVAEPWTLEPHRGLAAWVDAFDWSEALGGESPVVDEDDLEAMADLGIQTVYLQTSHLGVPDDVVLERERVERLIDAAHDNGMSVVAWVPPDARRRRP